MRFLLLAPLFCGLLWVSMMPNVKAEPTSGPVTIQQLRPYAIQGSSGLVFVYFNQIALCGTSVMTLDLSWGGAKEIYATLLTASVTGRQVKVELSNAGGCVSAAPWESKIQSVVLMP
jgi:hypothetical protein